MCISNAKPKQHQTFEKKNEAASMKTQVDGGICRLGFFFVDIIRIRFIAQHFRQIFLNLS